jgi:uncharacterized protein
MLLSLAKQVKGSGYRPEVIVGVSRGGWPPARIMSDLLENSNLANMKVEFYKDIGVRSDRPRITQPVTSQVTGKRVLVVDDVADSGRSLKVVASHLRRKGAKELKVSTIYYKPHSIFRPDFYARTTRKWIIFPWERLEAVRLIAKRFDSQRAKASTIIKELKGSGINERLVRLLLSVQDLDGRN